MAQDGTINYLNEKPTSYKDKKDQLIIFVWARFSMKEADLLISGLRLGIFVVPFEVKRTVLIMNYQSIYLPHGTAGQTKNVHSVSFYYLLLTRILVSRK